MKTYEAWEVDAMMATARAEGVREGRLAGLQAAKKAVCRYDNTVESPSPAAAAVIDLCEAAEREASA